jgi:toxin CcdB
MPRVRQLAVFDNPVTRARRVYPFVVVMQSDFIDTGPERIVACVVPRSRLPGGAGRLMPVVMLDGQEHLLLVQSLTSVLVADLRTSRGDLAKHRTEIVAALDHLFLGV